MREMTDVTRKQLIPDRLPSLAEIRKRAEEVSSGWTIGSCAFLDSAGVDSEREYKEKCKKEGRIMRHAHIGYNSVDETIHAIQYISRELADKGDRLDRFGICLDVQMGVPEEKRNLVPRGAGLVFQSEEDWIRIAEAAPVMVHFGDNMIGTLNSLENLRCAFAAGGTTIGNVSHYYTYEYPFAYDLNKRTVDMVTALCVMAKYKDRGMLVHSNLDDGFGALFHDLADTLGWAKIEKHIVEDIIGARLGHCFGNLFSDPILRIAFSFALDDINNGDSCGTMIYGNTTDFHSDFRMNYSVTNGYLLGDIIGQIHRPTGHALNAVPVSEAARIPSRDEILEAQIMSNELERYARMYEPYMDWEKISRCEQKLSHGADVFYHNVINELDRLGIDLTNPAEMMLAMKRLGPAWLELHCGAGKLQGEERVPVWPTDMVMRIDKIQEQALTHIKKGDLSRVRVVLCSTDVHEFGKNIVRSVLRKAGAEVIDIGTDASPEEIVETAIETDSCYITVSTFNGIAKTFAEKLLQTLEKYNLKIPIFMGGLLNENTENGNLPVDVTDELKSMGIICTKKAEEIVETMKTMETLKNEQA